MGPMEATVLVMRMNVFCKYLICYGDGESIGMCDLWTYGILRGECQYFDRKEKIYAIFV